MPSTKQGGGYTLTFSRKNKDIKELLEKKQQQGIIITDYICNAIRFFEANKDTSASAGNNVEYIQQLRKEEVLKQLINNNIKDPINSLEDNLEDIDIEDD